MSIREYANHLCLRRLLTMDAIQDLNPYPRRIVYVIFGIGMGSTFYFGVHYIPVAFVGSLLVTELLFRSMILGFLLVHIYIRSW